MDARISKTWTPSDIIQIAPGYTAMKIHVTNPSIFNKSDIVVFSEINTPILGYIYDKTPDGELHIFPLNGFPTSSISVATDIDLMNCDPAQLGVQIPDFQQLLTTSTDNSTPPCRKDKRTVTNTLQPRPLKARTRHARRGDARCDIADTLILNREPPNYQCNYSAKKREYG